MMTLNLKKGTLIFEGLLTFILGLVAIILPAVTTFSIIVVIGVLSIIAGIIQLVRVFQNAKTTYFWAGLISAVLAILVGILMLCYPLKGAMVLALLLGIWFLCHGILEIGFAINARHHSRTWSVMLLSGIISIILSIIIWSGWPISAIWIAGLLLGINLVFFGGALFILAFGLKPQALN